VARATRTWGATMSRRAARVDANHSDIVDALRGAGCLVQSLAAMGKGVLDLLVMVPAGTLYLLEVKGDKGQLTPDQVEWLMKGWIRSTHVRVVRTPEEALTAVGFTVRETT
jgi:hypothetical protein